MDRRAIGSARGLLKRWKMAHTRLPCPCIWLWIIDGIGTGRRLDGFCRSFRLIFQEDGGIICQKSCAASIGELIAVAQRRNRIGTEHVLNTLRERFIRILVELCQILNQMREVLNAAIIEVAAAGRSREARRAIPLESR